MKKYSLPLAVALLLTACSFTLPKHAMPIYEGPKIQNLCKDHEGAITINQNTIHETDTYTIEEFSATFRRTGKKKNDRVEGEWWRHKDMSPDRNLVVLIPGTGDRVSTENSAEPLVNAGFDVLRFFAGIDIFEKKEVEKKEVLTEEDVRAFARMGRETIRLRACDYLFMISSHFDDATSYRSIGISGVSLGGIFAPIIASQNQKIHAVLVMISGGNIAEILKTSTEKKIVETRDAIYARFSGDKKHMWSIIEDELVSIDPAMLAHMLDPNRTRIIANAWDHVIDSRFASTLAEKSGGELETILFPPGHYGSVLLLWIPMLRWQFACIVEPFCIPYPWALSRVAEINTQFFKEKLSP